MLLHGGDNVGAVLPYDEVQSPDPEGPFQRSLHSVQGSRRSDFICRYLNFYYDPD